MLSDHQNGIPLFRFESLPENGSLGKLRAGRLHHAIFTRQGGTSAAPFDTLNLSVSVPDEKERVYANRRRAYGMYGRDTDTVVHAHLVHGNDVAQVTQANNGTWMPRVDGIITNEPGCALTMNFADCTPIFLYDPAHHAIGLGHAGWQGTVKDLPGSMVRAMVQAFDSDPAQLLAGIGPCIGPCCYEVGELVITAVHETFPDADDLFVAPVGEKRPFSQGNGPHFDMPEANRRNLANAGVQQIELSGLCTACRTDLFFSHRAERGRTGRFGTIFVLGE
ncbi:MAG: peptidoglycan editing factor PgeF [Anaerolineae bacterium]|nr:peptidoglycan editing factor PgeF [Anaerolineae bacterium]